MPIPASIVPAAALAAAQAAAAGLPPAPRATSTRADRLEVVRSTLRGPVSQYEVKAGTIIPAVLLTGLNSTLEIRPGYVFNVMVTYVFNVMVTRDLVFPGRYDDAVRP